MSLNEPRQLRASEFFLTFEEEFKVHGQSPAGSQHGLSNNDGNEQIALVIRCTTGVNTAILDYRFKRRMIPQIQGVDGLSIEMAIDQKGRLPGSPKPLPIHHRGASRRQAS